ncbi:hypothetical protein FCM35_KLT17565 [Carex littledalei]|uniref:Uncharacterized protein n=1 Tax=Carex littledalei TaxID=544730 RepID=A0A833VWS8_9POAL|nr:hypothetical protein FCM35_KLT17565 [Carex littledalei]
MAENLAPGGQLPAGAFDPHPDPATVAANLVKVGIFISSSAISAMLRPLPPAVMMSHIHIQYAFGVALAVIFLFGLGMIGIGWLVADDPTRYTALGRAVTRASHVVLVFAIALHELPIAAFDPQPDPETQPKNLVKVGIFISSSAISAILRPLPRAVMMSHIHMQYVFGVALAMIFLFGVGMIGIGWLVADYPTRYTTLGRTVTRASHVMLVFTVALRLHIRNPR